MTSLQKQLASIAASSTYQLDLKAQKTAHSKSLLYEPRVAATQDFDTIYQICYEGFQELCMLDSRFIGFENNLFSDQSKGEERTQMTAKENTELDVVLESFLGLIGPKLLLKPALKAVEWLIRRFRVHEYNTEFLLLTFLPYHTAQVFPTLLSILPSNISPTFKFLYPYINSLANPPRHVIVYAASQNATFFSAFNQYILKVARARHHSQLFLSFWVGIVTQGVSGMLDVASSGRAAIQQQKQEDLLLRILPILNDGLAIKKVAELTLGCYTIMTVLASKGSLADNVLDGMMEAVTATWTASTIDSALVTLSVLSQEKQSVKLPKQVIRSLLVIDDLTARVLNLVKLFSMDKLALCITLGFLDRMDDSTCGVIAQIIERWWYTELLADQQKSLVIKALLRKADRLCNDAELQEASEQTRSHLANFLERIMEDSRGRDIVQEVLPASGINIKKLEFQLKTIISQARQDDVKKTEDSEMIDQPALIEGTELDAIVANLPKTTDVGSFLQGSRPQLFDDLVNVFMRCLSLPDGVGRFLSIPVSGYGNVRGALLLSFCARVWCGPYPLSARIAAIELVIRRMTAAEEDRIDYQALIPYVLCALADSSTKIRRLASELIGLIRKFLGKGNRKNKPVGATDVWGLDSIYAERSQKVRWLEGKSASDLLDMYLIPHAEEFALDADQVVRVLNKALNGSTEGHERMKSSLRESIFSYLGSHVAITPLQVVKLRLLPILQGVRKAGSDFRRHDLLPALYEWANASADAAENLCEYEKVDVADLDRVYIAVLNLSEDESIEALQKVARGDVGLGRTNIQKSAFQRLRNVWSSLKSSVRHRFADFLLEQSTALEAEAISPTCREEAAGTLRSVELSSDILHAFLESLPAAMSMPDAPHPAKRRRTSKSAMVVSGLENSAGTHAALQRFTFVLELVDGSNPAGRPELLKSLFHVLEELQHFKAQMHSDLAYLNTLVLDHLRAIIEGLLTKGAKADPSAINADLVVNCLRSNSSPSVRNAALLLISSLAAFAPELVLHSIMPIFTFMSSSVLRQGDDYSAHVIQKTIRQVIPALTESMQKQGQELVSSAAELLLSFTAAYEHVPLQRRMTIYGLLGETLGAQESLFAIVIMLFERYPHDESVLSFVENLTNHQDAAVQLHTAKRFVDVLSDALQPTRTISNTLLGLEDKDKASIHNSLATLLDNLSALLSNTQLRQKISTTLRRSSAAEPVKTVYAALLENVIQLSQRLTKQENLQPACARLLDRLLNVLPTMHFVEAAVPLLQSPDEQLCRSVIRTIEAHIRNANVDDERSRKALLELIPRLVRSLESTSDVLTKHAVVACIDQISERYGKKDPAAIASAARVIASESCLGSSDDRLRTISMLCLASMIEVIKDDSISLLPHVLPLAYEYLGQSIKSCSNEQLINAVYSVAFAVIEHIPYVFSGKYLDDLLRLSHRCAGMRELSSDIEDTRRQFYRLMAMQVDIKESLRAIKSTWDSALEEGHLALREHVDLLRMTVESNSKSAILRNSTALFDIILEAFDVRRRQNALHLQDKYTTEDLQYIEENVNKTVIATIMKMNDAAFRPFFVRLVYWATTGLPKRDKEGRTTRLTTLFTFLHSFFAELKSIVTSYSSYILEPAAEVLQNTMLTEVEGQRLWKAVLGALKQSFEHDQDDFWQAPSHFNSIMPPLVSQLSYGSTLLSTTDSSPFTVLKCTITELAVATSSTDHQKELNAAIMKHTRSDNSDIRLAAVKCEQSLTERLGEEWLGSLSEMLPFISELQQDDNEMVERETLRWIKRMEQIVGESLDPMLT